VKARVTPEQIRQQATSFVADRRYKTPAGAKQRLTASRKPPKKRRHAGGISGWIAAFAGLICG
jgi:hypothetical protein